MRPTSFAATWTHPLSPFGICSDFHWQSRCHPWFCVWARRAGRTRSSLATGARTALVTTRGFGDVLEIGYQARPRLFELTVRKPPVLTTAVVEIDERVTHDGQVLTAPNEATVRQQLQSLVDAGIESVAVCLLHADRHGAHERLVGNIAREVGFTEISLSHVVAPLPKFVARTDTTVVDAYLNPVLRDYVERLRTALPGSMVRILTSAGGLVGAEHFCGKDSILSGPAGGVVGFSRVAKAAGFSRAIGFDMGGTSTDVSRFDGRFDLEYETQKAGVRLVAPTMAIETVAAGGGSICRFDGVKLTVGPESAGAEPGPACYGRGGPLTVTDVNLFLGRIVAERFPFPLGSEARRSGGWTGTGRGSGQSVGACLFVGGVGGGVGADCGCEYGGGDSQRDRRQGSRSGGLRAGGVRRSGATTCVCGGARAWYSQGAESSECGRAQRDGDWPCRCGAASLAWY